MIKNDDIICTDGFYIAVSGDQVTHRLLLVIIIIFVVVVAIIIIIIIAIILSWYSNIAWSL